MFNQYNDPEMRYEIHYNSKCTGIFSVQYGDGLNEAKYTFLHALFDATIVEIDQAVRLAEYWTAFKNIRISTSFSF